MNIDQNLIFLFLVSQEYLTWVIASAAKSTEKKTCNLKNSHLTFTFSGVEWSCQKYCPGIRGCEDECCGELKINSFSSSMVFSWCADINVGNLH